MAVVSVQGPAFSLDFDDLDFSLFTSVTSASATNFSLNFSDGSRWDIQGSSFVYGGVNGLPTAGAIASITLVEPGSITAGSVTGLSLAASTFSGFVTSADEQGFFDSVLAGNDTILGGSPVDEVRAGAGSDQLIGYGGGDTLSGEDGSDILIGDNPGSANAIGAAVDLLDGGAGADLVDGGADADLIFGGDGDDWLHGSAGDDVVLGEEGIDLVLGGEGNDQIEGGGGDDVVLGGEGRDTLSGDSGNDWQQGGAGNDTLLGNDGNDVLLGEAGDDFLDGGSGNDHAAGGIGDDLFQGDDGNDTAFGGSAADSLIGDDGNDILSGDAGDDWLQGGAGNDVLIGGDGNDTASYTTAITVIGSSDDAVTIDAGDEGIDTLFGIEVYDTPQPAPQIDLTSLTSSQGFIVQGDSAGDGAGLALAPAGDVNGDGFADFIVAAPEAFVGGTYQGEVYVLFGGAGPFGVPVTTAGVARQVIDLSSLSSTQGFIIRGDAASDSAGSSVAGAGDINGDGFDDLIIGTPRGDDGGNAAGEAYVIFGHAGGFGTAETIAGAVRQVIDLTSLGSADGFVIQGDATFDGLGDSVAAAGDINGDGYDDLMVGAYGGDDGGLVAGETYVLFGGGGTFGTAVSSAGGVRQVIDLTSLTSAQGFIIQGDFNGDSSGESVDFGDINGDGFDDMVIAAPLGNDGGSDSGEVYVVFGGAGGFGVDVTTAGVVRRVVDLTSLVSSQGFIVQGDNGDGIGQSVSAAGDVNGDGYNDLIIGAYLTSPQNRLFAGETFIVFGSGAGFGQATTVGGVVRQVIDLATLDAAEGFVIQGAAAQDYSGGYVSSAGDVNGDGLDDLIVSSMGSDLGGDRAGQAYLIFGRADGFGSPNDENGSERQVIDLASLTETDGFIVVGDASGDYAGFDVAAAGDINHDGFDDLLVGALRGDDGGENAGETYVLFGTPTGTGTPVVLLGTSGAEILRGNSGNDTLSGGGGADVFRGGAGNDIFLVPDLAFADIDGGTGIDTLALLGSGHVLNLGTVRPSEITSLERIDLSGSGNNTLILDRFAVFDITEERGVGEAALRIDGNTGDVVSLDGGWVEVNSTFVDGNTYDRWQFDPDAGGPLPLMANAEMWIDSDITVDFFS